MTIFLLSSCALLGGGGETLKKASDYRVSPPKNWTASAQGESDRAFKLTSGNWVTLTSSCKRNPAPLEVLTRHLLFGIREQKFLEKKSLTLSGHPALLSHVKGRYEMEPVQLLVCVVSANDCLFDFVLFSSEKISNADRSEFIDFLESFSYGK